MADVFEVEKEILKEILDVYLSLHENKKGGQWIWYALERIAAGENERDVLRDYGYVRER